MEIVKVVFAWIWENIFDIALVAVGASAFITYFLQKKNEKRAAATLIVSQIDSIEEQISELKHKQQLNNDVMYYVKIILKENKWEQYKHLFVKRLSKSEYRLIQDFFDNAERLERVRAEIVDLIVTAWHDKSSVTHQTIAEMLKNHEEYGGKLENEILLFQNNFGKRDTGFTPDISIASLMLCLNNYTPISGTTAYAKLNKKSYSK